MTQRDLNRAVAIATGESVEMIDRLGFGMLSEAADDPDPQTIDWDEHDDSRTVLRSVRMRRLTAVA